MKKRILFSFFSLIYSMSSFSQSPVFQGDKNNLKKIGHIVCLMDDPGEIDYTHSNLFPKSFYNQQNSDVSTMHTIKTMAGKDYQARKFKSFRRLNLFFSTYRQALFRKTLVTDF